MGRKKRQSASRNRSAQKKKAGRKRRKAPARSAISQRMLVIVLLVVTGLALSPILTNDFISLDDDNFILSNPVVQKHDIGMALKKQLYTPHYKPLVYITWIVENALFGNNPVVFHLNNWLLHLLNTLLVFLCFQRVAGFWESARPHAVWIGFFTALLFGVHPLHVESVAWAIERKDVLFTCFFLAGLLNYLRFLDSRSRKHLLWAGAFYILSLLSKSMAITWIGVVFLMDWAAGRRDWKRMVLEKWPLVVGVLVGLFIYGILYQPEAKTFIGGFGQGAAAPPVNMSEAPGAYQQVLIANFRYLFFLFHSVFPVRLSLVYPREFLLAFPGGMVHALFVVTAALWALPFILRKYRVVLLTGLVFFTMTISPILIEEGPGTNFGSDRYTYVPSLGILLLISLFVLIKLKKPLIRQFTAGQVVLSGVALLFAIGSFTQSLRWGDSQSLYNQAVNNYPENWVALHYRGGELEEIDPQAALADYAESLRINPRRYKTWFSRGTLFLNLLRYEEALADFTRTIELSPGYMKAYVNRGNCKRDLGRNQEAIEDYNTVLKMNPRFIKGLNNRGVAYLNLGQFNRALDDFNKVLTQDPQYAKGYINRAAVYYNNQVQQYEDAIADYNRCLQFEPDNWQAHYFKGLSLQHLQRYEEALSSVNQAIALRPNAGVYHFSKAQLLKLLGRPAQSVQAAQTAQSLGYNVPAQYLSQ